jgi:hypothetical protein
VLSSEKANVMHTGVLWREEAAKLHKEKFSDVKLEHRYADALAMQLLRAPNQFDVIVSDNNEEDEETTSVVADVVRFDKETGWGKFRVSDEAGQISFFIPPEQRNELREEVIESETRSGFDDGSVRAR